MRANPEPDDDVAVFEKADHPIAPTDTSRVDRFRRMDALEVKAGVVRVCDEKPVRDSRLVSNVIRQCRQPFTKSRCGSRPHSFSGSSGSVKPARYSRRASSAIRARRSCERANKSSHRRSDSSSASMKAANASCSSAGSLAVSAITFSSSLPIARHCTRIDEAVSAHLRRRPVTAVRREIRAACRRTSTACTTPTEAELSE
jgi:hypothetical protein